MADRTKDDPIVTFEGLKTDEDRPAAVDLRGSATRSRDRSTHRQHHWLYEDLLN